MAPTMLTASTLASYSFCAPTAVRVSRHSGLRVGGSGLPYTNPVLTRAAIDGLSSPLEEGTSRGEGISRRGAVLAAIVTTVAGSFGSDLVLPPRSGATESKQTIRFIEDVKKIIEDDIVIRDYMVTGDMTQSIYGDNCTFTDPAAVLHGAKNYSEAVKSLYDTERSKSELLNIEVSGPRTIDVKFRITGYLNYPWRPFIRPFEASARYTVGDDNLIESYDEKWTISLLEAVAQMVTPSFLRKDAPKL